uniref:Uncharacterized protein n=1 Tax=Oryzias sinensis TaxID=183150 RepID=A0A8C7X7Y3_9TELE
GVGLFVIKYQPFTQLRLLCPLRVLHHSKLSRLARAFTSFINVVHARSKAPADRVSGLIE